MHDKPVSLFDNKAEVGGGFGDGNRVGDDFEVRSRRWSLIGDDAGTIVGVPVVQVGTAFDRQFGRESGTPGNAGDDRLAAGVENIGGSKIVASVGSSSKDELLQNGPAIAIGVCVIGRISVVCFPGKVVGGIVGAG